jgi:hypothetical protein
MPELNTCVPRFNRGTRSRGRAGEGRAGGAGAWAGAGAGGGDTDGRWGSMQGKGSKRFFTTRSKLLDGRRHTFRLYYSKTDMATYRMDRSGLSRRGLRRRGLEGGVPVGWAVMCRACPCPPCGTLGCTGGPRAPTRHRSRSLPAITPCRLMRHRIRLGFGWSNAGYLPRCGRGPAVSDHRKHSSDYSLDSETLKALNHSTLSWLGHQDVEAYS